jgi:hypothetical protein
LATSTKVLAAELLSGYTEEKANELAGIFQSTAEYIKHDVEHFLTMGIQPNFFDQTGSYDPSTKLELDADLILEGYNRFHLAYDSLCL